MSCQWWGLFKAFQNRKESGRIHIEIITDFDITQLLSSRYIPPLTGANPILPESRDDILQELRKQESVLSQIHNEMNSGYVTKRREEQLWEVQRIITQLKVGSFPPPANTSFNIKSIISEKTPPIR